MRYDAFLSRGGAEGRVELQTESDFKVGDEFKYELRPQLDARFYARARSSPTTFSGRAVDNDPQPVRESPQEIMARVWGTSVPWRERGVDPADGHRYSNVEHIPGSFAHPHTWPSSGA